MTGGYNFTGVCLSMAGVGILSWFLVLCPLGEGGVTSCPVTAPVLSSAPGLAQGGRGTPIQDRMG